MKKTTQIHMGGRHFIIDEDAYQKLNHYLESLENHFRSDGETGQEIVDDIEQRIAELLEGKMTNGKQSVVLEDVNEIIIKLGKVEDFSYADDSGERKQANAYSNRKDYRRLYRDPDNYYLGGVASGLGEYFDIDPLWIRIAFILLIFLKGVGVLLYLILWLVVPKARTTAEKLQMKGRPVNLSTIKDSVNEEYDRARSSDDLSMTSSERTRNNLDNFIRSVGLVMVALFKFMIGAIGVLFLIIGSVFLAGLVIFLLGFTNVLGTYQIWNGIEVPQFMSFFSTTSHYYMALISLVVVILIPIIAMIYGGIKLLFNIRTRHPVLRAFLLTGWILAFILFITLVILNARNSPVEASETQTTVVEIQSRQPYLVLALNDNSENKRLTRYWVMGYHFNYSRWDEELYDEASLQINRSNDDQVHLAITRKTKNVDPESSGDFMDDLSYRWEQKDSALFLNRYFQTDPEDFWMFPEVAVELSIPEGQNIILTDEVCEIMQEDQHKKYCENKTLVGKKAAMTATGNLEAVN